MTIVLDDILAKLDPKTRARVQSAQDIKVEKQLTPSIGLNMALKGGLGYGRQVLVWGNKSGIIRYAMDKGEINVTLGRN